MKCAGCHREIEIGERYIEDSASGFMASFSDAADPKYDDFVAKLLGGTDGKIVYCDDCTEPGGDYVFETFYGDEDDE